MLIPVVLLLGMFSCRKNDLVQPVKSVKENETALLLNTTSSQHLIYEETFEAGEPFTSYANLQTATSYGFTICNTKAFEGSKSGRFELRDTDPENSSGTRAEAKFPIQDNLNRWYSYAVYFPSADYQYDSKAEIINQWHQGGGVSPSISLITRYDKLIIESRTSPKEKTQYGLGSIIKDRWQTFVLHIIHSHGSDGLIEIWKDGTKIFSKQGANSYDFNTFERPKWKLGIYKWEWNGSKTTDTKRRVIYFDNIRLGNENCQLSEMVSKVATTPIYDSPTPATGTTPVSNNPVPPAISSFSLINASTDKEVATIADGETISLSKYGLSKINITAKSSSTTESIKFSLSGERTKNYTDDQAPFALLGDDNKGNFYYGSWNPPPTGKYTLQALPFASDGSALTAGKIATVHFTITK